MNKREKEIGGHSFREGRGNDKNPNLYRDEWNEISIHLHVGICIIFIIIVNNIFKRVMIIIADRQRRSTDIPQ